MLITAIAATCTRLERGDALAKWWRCIAVAFWMVLGFCLLVTTAGDTFRADFSTTLWDTWNYTIVGLCEAYLLLPWAMTTTQEMRHSNTLAQFGNQTSALTPHPDPEAQVVEDESVNAASEETIRPLQARTPRSRVPYLDHLKAFLTLLVVVHHITLVCAGTAYVGDFNLAFDTCQYTLQPFTGRQQCTVETTGQSFYTRVFAVWFVSQNQLYCARASPLPTTLAASGRRVTVRRSRLPLA